jgi:hypothetical protein
VSPSEAGGAVAGEARDWCVVLDLGEDARATELDALYLRSALNEAGVEAVFYPWEPSADVFTPLGAVRPLKLLVPSGSEVQARELVEDVLAGNPPRADIAVPIQDAWVLRYDIRIVVLHLRDRIVNDGGAWRWIGAAAAIVLLGPTIISLLFMR